MNSVKTLVFASLFGLIAACGDGGSQTVPQAEEAAQTEKDIGDHVVHFSAQTTDQLPSEVAMAYNIPRNPKLAMLNVSIIEKATNAPTEAEVSVKTVNLTGQLKDVEMRKIVEQEAIYYIGDTSVENMETLIFDISVQPPGVEEPAQIRFQRQFYTN